MNDQSPIRSNRTLTDELLERRTQAVARGVGLGQPGAKLNFKK